MDLMLSPLLFPFCARNLSNSYCVMPVPSLLLLYKLVHNRIRAELCDYKRATINILCNAHSWGELVFKLFVKANHNKLIPFGWWLTTGWLCWRIWRAGLDEQVGGLWMAFLRTPLHFLIFSMKNFVGFVVYIYGKWIIANEGWCFDDNCCIIETV